MSACLILVLALVFGAGTAGAADRQQEMSAREAFAAGRYPEALELFAKLYAETLHPVYLRNIGRCHQKMREPQKAIDAFHDYVARTKKMPADEKIEIDGYIKEMEALRDEQARAAKPPVSEPPPPPLVAPPPAANPTPTQPAVMLATPAGEPQAGADDHPIYTRWWFWTAIGVAVAGVTAAVLLSGGGTRPACPPEAMGACK